jgi:hypothetical protein
MKIIKKKVCISFDLILLILIILYFIYTGKYVPGASWVFEEEEDKTLGSSSVFRLVSSTHAKGLENKVGLKTLEKSEENIDDFLDDFESESSSIKTVNEKVKDTKISFVQDNNVIKEQIVIGVNKTVIKEECDSNTSAFLDEFDDFIGNKNDS